jgi:NAD(P)-dependent dehydrogenase (short-subunit alcohol dehydrogenase family)
LIINVASYWAGGLNLDDPEFKHRSYNNDVAYRQSKQADRMLSYGMADIFKDKIDVVACHPGDANSKLSNDLGFGGSESAKQAAEMPLSLATGKMGAVISGAYYEHGRIANCRFKSDREGISRLLEICESY